MNFQLPDELIFMKNKNAVQKVCIETMAGKICVVTGSTSGVGLATIKRLARGGAKIVMVCRNKSKGELVKKEIKEKYNAEVDLVFADFSNLNEVRRAASEILNKYPKIDVLINSVGMHSTKKIYTEEGFELVYCVNHLAPFLFTYLLLDRLKQSAPARIIQVNSEGHRFNGLNIDDLNWKKRHYTGLRGYGASKTAQLMTVWELADQLSGSGVTINAVHPGDVRTNIGENNGWLYKLFLHRVTWIFLRDVEISGNAIYYLAASSEMANTSGKFFNLTTEEKPAKHALDREIGKRIWNQSIQMTCLDNE